MSYHFKNCSYKSDNKVIIGSLYLSEDSNKWAVFCHGFTGHRIGPGYLFVHLARHLASSGINVLSFDFTGCGESEGNFCDMTVEKLCKDLENSVNFIKNNFSPEKILLLGHSFGGMIAALLANELKADGTILLSPVADIDKHVLGHTKIFTGESRGDGTYSIGPFKLKMEFLQSFKESNPVKVFCNSYNKPTLLIQGERDDTITKDESYLYILESEKRNFSIDYEIIKNGDHSFSDVDQRDYLKSTLTSWIKEKIN